jgi:hypothetical protein
LRKLKITHREDLLVASTNSIFYICLKIRIRYKHLASRGSVISAHHKIEECVRNVDTRPN